VGSGWTFACQLDVISLMFFRIHDLFGLEGRFDCLRVSEDSYIISASGAGKNANLTIFIQEVMLYFIFC
jgi:hypothetical protein